MSFGQRSDTKSLNSREIWEKTCVTFSSALCLLGSSNVIGAMAPGGIDMAMFESRMYGKGPWMKVLHYYDVIMGAMAYQITSLTIVYSVVYSGADKRTHQSCASLAFVRGIHRGPVNSPHKWPVTRKIFPFDDVIMEGPFTEMRGISTFTATSYSKSDWNGPILQVTIWMENLNVARITTEYYCMGHIDDTISIIVILRLVYASPNSDMLWQDMWLHN